MTGSSGGNEVQLKAQGYGGHHMRAYPHRRRHGQMMAWLSDAGFAVGTTRTLALAESKLGESFSRAAG